MSRVRLHSTYARMKMKFLSLFSVDSKCVCMLDVNVEKVSKIREKPREPTTTTQESLDSVKPNVFHARSNLFQFTFILNHPARLQPAIAVYSLSGYICVFPIWAMGHLFTPRRRDTTTYFYNLKLSNPAKLRAISLPRLRFKSKNLVMFDSPAVKTPRSTSMQRRIVICASIPLFEKVFNI